METIFLNISAGSGPEECAHAAALTLQALQKEIKDKKDLTIRIIETEPSRIKGNFRSVLISKEQTDREAEARSELRHSHWELERGNPVRVYDGETLKPVRISFKKKQEKSLKNEKT